MDIEAIKTRVNAIKTLHNGEYIMFPKAIIEDLLAENEALKKRCEAAEKERDAAINDIKFALTDQCLCTTCKNDTEEEPAPLDSKCASCDCMNNYEWRGPQEG